MKRRTGLVVAAAVVVLAVQAWLLAAAAWNRGGAGNGRLELTERELRLVDMPGESSAVVLELRWRALAGAGDEWHSPAWLDVGKLTELGFDCRVPVTATEARRHYHSLPPRECFLVLEYAGDAWRASGRDQPGDTRLFVVDAGREPGPLGARYADPERYVVVRGVIRVSWDDWDRRADRRRSEPVLRGWLESVQPTQVFVPRPENRLLLELGRAAEPVRERETSAREPRYAVRVAWGRNHEPWVEAVRRLDGAGP